MKGLIGSSKRVLSGTKNEEKVKAIKAAVKILEDFLEQFDVENRATKNKAYLPAEVLEKLPSKPANKLVSEFIEVYTAKRNYKMLRTLEPVDSKESKTWDIIRNRELSKIKFDEGKLFKDNGEPTETHLQLIYWGYSPEPAKVKTFYGVDTKSAAKRESSGDTSSSPAKKRR